MESPSPKRFDLRMTELNNEKENSNQYSNENIGLIEMEGLRRRTNSNVIGSNKSNLNGASFRPPKTSLMMSGIGMDTTTAKNMPNANHDGIRNNWNNVGNTDSSLQGSTVPNLVNTESTQLTIPAVIQDEIDDDDDGDLNHIEKWVVIIFGSNPNLYPTIQQRFESYGTVVSIHTPTSNKVMSASGNWMCIKYVSRLEAEKAICQDGTFHRTKNIHRHSQDCILLGVKRLNQSMAQKLGVDIYSSSYIHHKHHESSIYDNDIFNPTPKNGDNDDEKKQFQNGFYQKSESMESYVNDESIFLQASSSSKSSDNRKKGGVCSKILSWIFMWD